MQLHSLRLQAIGPFVGEFEVDFVALAAGGIFLLEGPTGAGKSTLIDAIVYALYGDVASASASKERIRSGFAAPGVESYVDLVFETGSGVFRVRRSPEMLRPKRRGEGTTKVQAAASLWRLGSPDNRDGGEHLSGRLDEVGAEIQRAVGLTRAQFVQTIVLPQGEFATFLKAKPEARREVLQRVFGTQDYEAVQAHLAELRREVSARTERAQREVEDAVTALCTALGSFEDDASIPNELMAAARRESPGGTSLATLVAEQVTRVTGEAEVAEALVAAAELADAEAKLAFDTARARRQAAERRVVLVARLAALDAVEEVQIERKERLDAARRAAVVAGSLSSLAQAQEAVRTAKERLDRLDVPSDLAALDDPGLTVARGEAQRTLGELTGAQALAVELDERSKERDEVRASLARTEELSTEVRTEQAERPAARKALEDQLAAARTVAEGRGRAEERLDGATKRFDAARRVAELTDQLESRSVELARLIAAAKERVVTEAALRSARLAGIAGELAAELADGAPCPVCGAVDHPRPATLTADHPHADQVAEAEDARHAAESAVMSARSRVGEVEGQLAAQAAIAEGLSVEAAAAAKGDAAAALSEAKSAETLRDSLVEKLEAAQREDQRLGERATQLEAALADLRARLTALDKRIAADEVALENARGDFPTLDARVAALRSRAEVAERLLGARTALAAATVQCGSCETALTTALDEHDFLDAAAARAAQLAPSALRALEAEITAHAEERTKVESGLADPALLAALDGLDIAALDAGTLDPATLQVAESRAALAAAERAQELRDAATLATVRRRRATDCTDRGAALDTLLEANAATLTAAEPVLRMADLAAGAGPDNPRRLTLATYVLLRRFEEVVEVANERLAVMSDGRYALERSDERESGGGLRQGLALRVRDNTIDALRDPHTLSGGETFYVSLCLALALAQVVTAEAGGVDLGTLFVDEGFGTLDPHVLEAVLSELGKLHAEGRVVGIISHVAELKEAIAERIEVRKTAQGPSTLRVVA